MNFNTDGLLPPEDYELTLDELRESVLVRGPEVENPWDVKWRLFLVNNLEVLIQQLWNVGVDQIYIDGSFVEDKAHPNDIDGYFECDLMELATGELERKLNALDPYKVWTWDSSSRKTIGGLLKSNYRCGTDIVWNYTLISGNPPESWTNMEMNSNFPGPLGKREIHFCQKAL